MTKHVPLDGAAAARLLLPDEAPPFSLINPEGKAPLLFICDHASPAVPDSLDNLGLDQESLHGHIGWDAGAAEMTRFLSARFDAPALLAGYSRLVIDLNREPGHPASIMERSDGTEIPGNRGLDGAEARRRAQALFHPYHRALSARLEEFAQNGVVPALIAVHSFTPALEAEIRPWQISVLWNRDPRIAEPLIEKLSRLHPDIRVGENLPYTGKEFNYTIDTHGQAAGIPHVAVEFRNDLIGNPRGVEHWGGVLERSLGPVLEDPELYRVAHFRCPPGRRHSPSGSRQ